MAEEFEKTIKEVTDVIRNGALPLWKVTDDDVICFKEDIEPCTLTIKIKPPENGGVSMIWNDQHIAYTFFDNDGYWNRYWNTYDLLGAIEELTIDDIRSSVLAVCVR